MNNFKFIFIVFIGLLINVYGSIEENFAGGGISVEGKGYFRYRQYDINNDWDKSMYLYFAGGVGFYPKDRLELFISPVFESVYYQDKGKWFSNPNGHFDIGAKYEFLLNSKESSGFVLIPGISIGNYIDGFGYGYEYSISVCPFARVAYFFTSRFAGYVSFEPRYIIRTKEPNGLDTYLNFGAEYYFPRFMKILFKKKE